MRFKGIIAFIITSFAAISMSVTAFALDYHNENVSIFTDQRDVGYMKHTAWNGWTGTAPSPSGYTNGYDTSYKVASYSEYKDSIGNLVIIYDSGYVGGTSNVVKTNIYRTVSSECVKRHHFSCIHIGSNPDSTIMNSTTTNVFKN